VTGSEHYREAERLLAWGCSSDGNPGEGPVIDTIMACAQVHATLALAAATLGTLEEQRLAAIADDKIDEAMRAHIEDEPHIYPDGSRS
jgi:hypothetical protein